MKKFCEITSRNALADYLGIKRRTLTHLLYVQHTENCYISFDIPKKSGGTRHINAPVGELKAIQRKLASALSIYQDTVFKEKRIKPCISHAFEQGKSIVSNARIHRNKRFVLNIDLEDFFDSFHFGRVRGFFMKNKDFMLSEEVATVIAQLSCYNGCLPQGAPSSPIITNLICQILDMRLLSIAKHYRLDYSRYADDLTFSTNDSSFLQEKDSFLATVRHVISKYGFSINESKTRFQYIDSRQTVTGLVVNKQIGVPSEYCRTTRAMAHTLYKTGSFSIDGQPGTLSQLEGRFSFIEHIEKVYRPVKPFKLNRRERQYQQFLFYKHFFSLEQPMIVTEGKTDILYIKAALMNLYRDYPDLVKKNDDGSFSFKVSFLHRSEWQSGLFSMSATGADALCRLYSFFKGSNNAPCYPKFFSKISGAYPNHPVIFVFDNEASNANKPLAKFFKTCSIAQDIKDALKSNLFSPLCENLYIVTNPLVRDLSECEIEDLFFPETLMHEINGK